MAEFDSQQSRILGFRAARVAERKPAAEVRSAVGHTGTYEREFEEFFRLHGPRLGRFLAQVVSDRSLADDLLQETFLAAWRKRARLETIENPEAWLFSIARNRALQALRRRRRAFRALQRLAGERARSEPDPAEAIAVRDHLVRCLDPEERILLVLRYAHGFGSKDLAKIVGRSSDAVRKQLSRASHKLIDSLDETEPSSLLPRATDHDQESEAT